MERKNSRIFVINSLDKYGSSGPGSSSYGLKSGECDMDISNKQTCFFACVKYVYFRISNVRIRGF